MPRVQIALLMVLVILLGVGCKGRGGVLDRSEDWERAYYRSGERIVIDQFEIDVRNTRALSKVFGYRQESVVISAEGDGLINTLEGVEIFPVSSAIREGLRDASTQSTLRRTQQFSFKYSNAGAGYTVLLPSQTSGYRTTAGIGSSEMVTLNDLAWVFGPPERYEEGIALRTRLYGDRAQQASRQELIDLNLFLKPGQTIVLRTSPSPGTVSPLSFERDGQQYETVYLVSYVQVREYMPTVRDLLSF